MKKLHKTLLIILAILLLVGVGCVVAGAVLGAHPLEIAKAILQGFAARIGLGQLPKL